jgi:hypothetical protein
MGLFRICGNYAFGQTYLRMVSPRWWAFVGQEGKIRDEHNRAFSAARLGLRINLRHDKFYTTARLVAKVMRAYLEFRIRQNPLMRAYSLTTFLPRLHCVLQSLSF